MILLSIRRPVLAFAGLSAIVTALFVPDALQSQVITAVETFGNDYILIAIVAVAVILTAMLVVFSGRSSNRHRADLPEPERPVRGRVPGATIDDHLRSWRIFLPIVGRYERASVVGRIRQAGIRAVMIADGCSRDDATTALDRGTWTNDPVAASFLDVETGPTGSHWHPRFPAQARRTIEVIESYARGGGEPDLPEITEETAHSPTNPGRVSAD